MIYTNRKHGSGEEVANSINIELFNVHFLCGIVLLGFRSIRRNVMFASEHNSSRPSNKKGSCIFFVDDESCHCCVDTSQGVFM
jgi:hypothetical protein